MVSTTRTSRIIATICLVCAPFTGVPLAAQAAQPAARTGQSAFALPFTGASSLPARFTLKEPLSSIVTLTPSEPVALAQRGWGRGRGRGGRNSGARTAIILGSVAAVAGSAVLVYANRPECRADGSATGCGYGAKVLGGAVLAGGAVGIATGALTWR